jgi:two-component system response regulator GlrR
MPAIILTAYGSIENAVNAMQRGAFTYLCKPFEIHELLLQIENAIKSTSFQQEVKTLKGQPLQNYQFPNIVARSEKMQQVLAQVSRIAGIDSTVYIYGESGTGKELIAQAIHAASPRKGKSFVAINCAAIPDTLLESELFGYEKGAFTGAYRSTKGLFIQAHEGTIFLDEIGNMPLATQAKCLRVLQERQFYPIGGKRAITVDIRVVVATNRALEEEVRKGNFREDLLYRVNVIPITIPPLRERKEDIPPLVQYFLENFTEKLGKPVKGLTPAAMQKLMLYDWPGNVRQLENTIEYAVAMTQHEMITEESIPTVKNTNQELFATLKDAKKAFMRDYLMHLLNMTTGDVSKAAELAGQSRTNFYNILKRYGVKLKNFKEM